MSAGRKRKRNIRVLGVAERERRRGVLVTDIVASDYDRLTLLLLSKPSEVLSRFPVLQIFSLSQLDDWERLKAEQAEAAARIVAIAALFGIPENLVPVMAEAAAV